MANHDLPSMLNYVLHVTSAQKLFYVGHSQGTLIAFARLSRDHVLASKVCSIIQPTISLFAVVTVFCLMSGKWYLKLYFQ